MKFWGKKLKKKKKNLANCLYIVNESKSVCVKITCAISLG